MWRTQEWPKSRDELQKTHEGRSRNQKPIIAGKIAIDFKTLGHLAKKGVSYQSFSYRDIIQQQIVKIKWIIIIRPSQETWRRDAGRANLNFPRTVAQRTAQPDQPPTPCPLITACPSGHLCTEGTKCPPADRAGGPPWWGPDRCDLEKCPASLTEGDTPEKISG